ncbi:MAG: DNA polymerase III subunit delta [Nitrospirae bacterium]|nr:DNA polymerase III subunit delta [Nitrospirota bacterium]
MASVKPQEFFSSIEKGPLAPVYLLTGEEGYFIDRALAKILTRALEGVAKDFNLDVFYGKDAKADDIVSQASTLPMMSERRVVVVKEADRLKGTEPLLAYLASPAPETVMILVAEGAEKPKEAALTKPMSKSCVFVHFYPPFESEVPRWIKQLARESGYTVDDDAAAYLRDTLGGNLALVEAELNKLFNFLGDRKTITPDDVRESVGDFGMPLVFDLMDAVAEKRTGAALEVLSRLLTDKENNPIMLVGMFAAHWRRLLAAKEMADAGDGPEKLEKAFRLNFRNKKAFLGQVARARATELRAAFRSFAKADGALKGSALPQRLVMERLILELSGAGGF